MALTVPILCLTAVLAGVIGFAAHRASLCTVRAVEEVLSTRRGYMLMSFCKTALWVIGATLLGAWVLPIDFVAVGGWRLSMVTIGGGLLFGVGATINGGCAISTLTRLGGGNLGMIVSFAGFLIGVAAYTATTASGYTTATVGTTAALSTAGAWRGPVTAALTLWMAWELIRLARSVGLLGGWRDRLLAPHYRLSTAALLMGLSNAVLYASIGVWPYTRLFGDLARYVMIGASPPALTLWLLFIAMIAGIALSAWQVRRFLWQWRPGRRWAAYGMGGLLMGFGAAMIPGGNDVLIMHGIPSLSPHAIPAFLGILVGIALSLIAMRALGANIPPTDCSGDICTTELK
jgi:hypothetical protein